jgi:hypothetical protein
VVAAAPKRIMNATLTHKSQFSKVLFQKNFRNSIPHKSDVPRIRGTRHMVEDISILVPIDADEFVDEVIHPFVI